MIIKAKIIDYISQVMHDDYSDGNFVFYDATIFEIIAPEHLAYRRVSVYHNESVDKNSLWCKKDAICRFSINEEYIENKEGKSYIIFGDAIESSLKEEFP